MCLVLSQLTHSSAEGLPGTQFLHSGGDLNVPLANSKAILVPINTFFFFFKSEVKVRLSCSVNNEC